MGLKVSQSVDLPISLSLAALDSLDPGISRSPCVLPRALRGRYFSGRLPFPRNFLSFFPLVSFRPHSAAFSNDASRCKCEQQINPPTKGRRHRCASGIARKDKTVIRPFVFLSRRITGSYLFPSLGGQTEDLRRGKSAKLIAGSNSRGFHLVF